MFTLIPIQKTEAHQEVGENILQLQKTFTRTYGYLQLLKLIPSKNDAREHTLSPFDKHYEQKQ